MLCSCNDFSDMMLFGQADFGLAYDPSGFRQAVPPSHPPKPQMLIKAIRPRNSGQAELPSLTLSNRKIA